MKKILLILGLIFTLTFPISASEIDIAASSFVADPEFPLLLPYIIDGWDLKHKMFPERKYTDIVPVGATLHLYLHNSSNTPSEIEKVFLNKIDLKQQILPMHRDHDGIQAASYLLNDATTTPPEIQDRLNSLGRPIWYQVRPNPIPAQGFAELTIRLRHLPENNNLVVKVEDANGNSSHQKILSSKETEILIAGTSFSENLEKLYLYLQHSEEKEFEMRSIRLNDLKIYPGKEIHWKSFKGFLPLEIPLSQPPEAGSYFYIEAETRKGQKAAAVVRPYKPYFSLGMWGYRWDGNSDDERARNTSKVFRDYLFNTDMGTGGHGGYLRSAEGLEYLKSLGMRMLIRDPAKPDIRSPELYTRFLMDEPDAHEHSVEQLPAHLRLGSYAQGLVERQRRWTEIDPLTPTLLNVDLTYKPQNWLTYGQLPDIFALDPYYPMRLSDTYSRHPGWLSQYCHPYYVFALSEVARFACQPKPLHVILNSVSYRDENPAHSFRYSTPEEKRIEFYYALAAGAKGISYWWFTPYGPYRGCGSSDPEAKILMKEMAKLNAEVRAMLPLWMHACPGATPSGKRDPFAAPLPTWLWTRTLFVGEKTAIVIMVNRDQASDRLGSIYQPVENCRFTFISPPWLNPNHVFRWADSKLQSVPFTQEEETLNMEFRNIHLTEVLILTEYPSLQEAIRERWKELLPELEAVQ